MMRSPPVSSKYEDPVTCCAAPKNFILTIDANLLDYFIPEKNVWARRPATGGKKNVQTKRTNVNFQPMIPISMGILATAQRDQAVIYATIVPHPAPALRSPAANGRLT
jgi:hypothetical protein